MKKIFSILLFTLSVNYLFSQTDFKWEKIDSVPKTKYQIYSDTKMFIAENWKSVQNVIQNDDKEAGLILVKGTTSIDMPFMLKSIWKGKILIILIGNVALKRSIFLLIILYVLIKIITLHREDKTKPVVKKADQRLQATTYLLNTLF